MQRKKIWTDPTFWVLMGLNAYLVYRYYQHPEIFMTLVFLYWSQSMLMGAFTVLDLLTVKNTTPITYNINNVFKSLQDDGKSRRSSARFFVLTYGVLHLLYLLFLATMKKNYPPIQWDFFKYFFFAFFAGQVITFIQHKIQQRKQATDTGPIIFSPFIRALPMHLTIIFASHFPAGSVGLFLVFKSATDVVTYSMTRPTYKGRETDAVTLATQQEMNANL